MQKDLDLQINPVDGNKASGVKWFVGNLSLSERGWFLAWILAISTLVCLATIYVVVLTWEQLPRGL